MDHFDGTEVALETILERDLHSHPSGPPYQIAEDPGVGRHLIASRDIKPGEVIFKEAPLTFGPADTTLALCLGCYRVIESISFLCTGCAYPLCSADCERISEHRDNECKAFQMNGYRLCPHSIDLTGNRVAEKGVDPTYAIISPIRALMLKERDPAKWALIWSLMSHDKKRRASPFWRERTAIVVEATKQAISLQSSDEVKTLEILLGIFLVNDFEVATYDPSQEGRDHGDTSIRALFSLASMPSHDCIANCTHDFSSREDGYVMTMRAVRRIRKGEDITHSYTEPLDTVLRRQSLLQMGKFFTCNCQRCRDPTELGTFASAVLCQKCKEGFLISSDVSKLDADWLCNKCTAKMNCGRVQELAQAAKKEADLLDKSNGASIDDYEAFISKHQKAFHHNHVVLVDRKYNLAKMYGRISGFEADKLTDEQFKRKRKLCEEVLEVFNKIMPGRSRKRAMMMYELHLPLVMLANRDLQRGPGALGVDPEQIKSDLKAGLFNLRMALEILKDEPRNSFEWKIVEGSKGSVQQLQEWVTTVCSSL